MLTAWIDLLLPPLCPLCGDHVDRTDLCATCDQLLRQSWPAAAAPCPGCGLPSPQVVVSDRSLEPILASDTPLPPGTNGQHQQRPVCSSCQGSQFDFDAVFVLAVYQGPVREAVVANKHGGCPALAPALGKRLAACVQRLPGTIPPDGVTFVPTPLRRRLARGGQGGCQRVALAVSQALGIPLLDCLRTTRMVAKQSLLPDSRRQENVRGAFDLKKSYASKESTILANRHILLVDDVLTTGATASEVARILKLGGAASVQLAVIARAVRH